MSFFHAPSIEFRQYNPKTQSPAISPTDECASEKVRRERRRALILPREHGAWGLLLVPMVTGAGVALHHASQIFPLILLLTAALALFWLRTPLESLLGTSAMRAQTLEESHTLRSAVVLLAGIAAVALAGLLWAGRNFDLWPLGAAVAGAFVLQAVLKRLSRRTRMLSEMIGAIGLTAAAPAAYYVIAENSTRRPGPFGSSIFSSPETRFTTCNCESTLQKSTAFAPGSPTAGDLQWDRRS